ncbi:hypothetical protein [Streptomyces sp. NPDC059080]|uniref:hypothetical protein n=1 Tax=Streptomyces sp. NPDC059080 TaxID=3346718 RepID=UPI003685D03A
MAELTPYARQMASVAGHDFDVLETLPDDAERAETAVAAAILREPVRLALRRVPQEEESARRYGP